MAGDHDIIKRFSERVGYSEAEQEKFKEGGHRIRQIKRLSQAAKLHSIEGKVVQSRGCNSGYKIADKFMMDVDGNFISKLCPRRMCVHLVSQLTIPVALINERLSENLDPNQFHFMHYVRCSDVGVECSGYGEVMLRVQVVPRQSG